MRPRSVVHHPQSLHFSRVLQVVTRRLASYKYMLRESRLFDRANALDQLTQKLKRCARQRSACVPDRVWLCRCTNVALPLGQLSSKPSASSEYAHLLRYALTDWRSRRPGVFRFRSHNAVLSLLLELAGERDQSLWNHVDM
jgi:hypothetical protein